MAKIKNADYIRDAITICDRLDTVTDLNRSSAALLKVARAGIENDDGRWAFDKASLADYMDYFVRNILKH